MYENIYIIEEQQRQFDEDGFFLIEDVLSPTEVEDLIAVVDELDAKYRREEEIAPDKPFHVRNALAHHEQLLRLVNHPVMLPLVVDVLGFNIQIRISPLDAQPPCPPEYAQ